MIPFDKVDIEVITGRIYKLRVCNFKTGATNDLTHPRKLKLFFFDLGVEVA
jgi:hypothetical protein